MSLSLGLINFFSGGQQTGGLGPQSATTPLVGIDGSAQFLAPQRLRDVVGKLKVSQSQNIYDADFEYGVQPLRWENVINNASGQASIVQNPGLGGVTMTIGGAASPGDITIRQSRPYHRYQPGKTFYMASNVNFGASVSGQFQRVGIFDDSNGIFFMQSGTGGGTVNPYGMSVVIRSDSGGLPVDTVFPADQWNGNQKIRDALNWSLVQMIWMEYAWYGAGACRWGVVIDGEPWVLHQVGTGNGLLNKTSGANTPQTTPWSRTGNLPVRYEQRDNGTGAPSVMTHYGVSVLIEGSIDRQRGFTYSYGNDAKTQTRSPSTAITRYPAMSFRMRAIGTDVFDQTNAAISSGTNSTLTIGSSGATPAINSVVGQANNGQALLTFASAHGYAVTNTAQANNPAQYITLSSFTEVGTSTTGNYSAAGTTLTITAAASGVFQAGAVLSGTGTVAGSTIVQQLTSTATAATTTTAANVAIGANIIPITSASGVVVGQIVSATGIPAGAYVQQINGTTIVISAFTTAAITSGTSIAFGTPGVAGTYQMSSAQGTLSGTLTATTTYAAQTWLIQNIPSTTTMVLPIILQNGVTATTNPTATYWGVNQFVGKFVYYQASMPSVSTISNPASSTIAGLTNYTSTITFSSAHNLKQGDVIYISGATPAGMNGIFSVNTVYSAGVASTTAISVNWGNVNPGNYSSGATIVSPYTARITSNTVSTITFQDIVTGLPMANAPASGNNYQIGLIDRGQLLPQTLLLNSSQTCLVELISSTPTNQLSLSQANFVPLNTLGSYNSFAEQDLTATSLSGGEVVYAFSTPPNGLQQLDLTNFFPVLTNVRGNVADILTVAVTCSNSSGVNLQINVVCQEAMA